MIDLFKEWSARGLLNNEQFNYLKRQQSAERFSLFFEFRALLYIGIVLICAGLGALTYQNLDTIGHTTLQGLLILIFLGTYVFILKKSPPFNSSKTNFPTAYLDHIVLLNAMILISIPAYFGIVYELSPEYLKVFALALSLYFFYSSYRFDHQGVLSMAITSFGTFVGFSFSPFNIQRSEFLPSEQIALIGIFFSLLLFLASFASTRKNFKAHFNATYLQFGHLIFFSCILVQCFLKGPLGLWIPLSILAGIFGSILNWKSKRFSYFLLSNLLVYIQLSYLLTEWVFDHSDAWVLAIYYYPFSALAYLFILLNHKGHFRND